ncbi:Trypsin, alkaline B [Eumeta japonica]|uniref:Trypsin, alkaline B n=1 Tax=Eumeta variegata TaxID=151549 RepID=A0A4C1ZTV8_EUMVA|nr:Trypsin, alkaline B [Eumeta japonica]
MVQHRRPRGVLSLRSTVTTCVTYSRNTCQFYSFCFCCPSASAPQTSAKVATYSVRKVTHPNYTRDRDYDLSILELKSKLKFSEKWPSRSYQLQKKIIRQTRCSTSPDGVTRVLFFAYEICIRCPSPASRFSTTVSRLNGSCDRRCRVDQKTCKTEYTGMFEINDHMLCAGGEAHDACQWRPLSLKGVVVGVVSEEVRTRLPTVYMKVSRFIGWIENTIKY